MQPNALLWIINLCLFSSRFQHGNTAWPPPINHCNFLLGDFHWGSNNDSTSHGEAFHCLVRQISVNSKSDISSTSQIKKLWCDNWAEKNKNWQRSTLFEWELCQSSVNMLPWIISNLHLFRLDFSCMATWCGLSETLNQSLQTLMCSFSIGGWTSQPHVIWWLLDIRFWIIDVIHIHVLFLEQAIYWTYLETHKKKDMGD